MQPWEKPAFIEVDMSAEIGGYQGDPFENPNGPDHAPDFAAPAVQAPATADKA